jgi:hypothetical protein
MRNHPGIPKNLKEEMITVAADILRSCRGDLVRYLCDSAWKAHVFVEYTDTLDT